MPFRSNTELEATHWTFHSTDAELVFANKEWSFLEGSVHRLLGQEDNSPATERDSPVESVQTGTAQEIL